MRLQTLASLIFAACLMSAIAPAARGNDFTDWLLGRHGEGANHPTWNGCGCRCCPDYCPKPWPCTPCLSTPCCDNYCKKPWPCTPTLCPSCCPNYCPKPWPCWWKPMCGPFNWCGEKPCE